MAHHILVTGCCGFIGSHLTERLLSEGYTVTGIDNFDPFYDRSTKEKNLALFSSHPSFQFFEADIRDKNFAAPFLNEKFDAVIHLAAKAGIRPSLEDVTGYIDTNINGTANLLEFMKSRSIGKLIFTSSSSVYGNSTQVPFNEEEPLNKPISPYAFTKLSGEMLCYAFQKLYNIDVVSLRLFTVYGPRQRPDLAIHKFVKLMYEGKAITMFGEGDTSRDYTYVSDIIEGYSAALQFLLNTNNLFEIFNLGNSNRVPLKDLINEIANVMQISPTIVQDKDQPGDVETTCADVSKAKLELGFQPKVSLYNGLQNFVVWFYAIKKNEHNN